MRLALLACIALALAAGCIDPGDSADSGSGSTTWVLTDITG